MKPLLILKIGGSIITDKSSEEPKANLDVIKRIEKEISNSYERDKFNLIIVTGAGSYGHPIVKRTKIHEGIKNEEQLSAFAETQRLQNEFNSIFTKYLIDIGIPAIPCQPSSSAVMQSKNLIHLDTKAIEGFLKIGLIPVLFGVPAYDEEQNCSILSGDQIAPYLAKKLKAIKIIHATDVDGIFTDDPKKNENAKLIREINQNNLNDVKKWLAGSSNIDVTGGMFGKVSELLDLGVESQIINGLNENNISRALKGDIIGTTIRL